MNEDIIRAADSPGIHAQGNMPNVVDTVFVNLVRRGSVLILFVEKGRVQAELG